MREKTESAGYQEAKEAILQRARALGLKGLQNIEELIETYGLDHAMNWIDLFEQKMKSQSRIRIVFSNEERKAKETIDNTPIIPNFVDFDVKKRILVFDKPIKKLTLESLVQIITHLPATVGILYGNLATMTLRNNQGHIVAKLYILPNGKLAVDSWLNNEGWK